MLRLAFYLVAGYSIAAANSDSISFDLSQTDWLNLWTYIYIGVGMAAAWVLFVLFWILAVGVASGIMAVTKERRISKYRGSKR